ncbi:helix-turn-helix domain-containing protein [Streptomyces sp. ITFR-6]|uniref:helix-turn-helix domain-containing protein n=1 Tax=Streptomyces sp. ITFR-6 TaxID=3075197 RepID=UPI00288A4538|nr:helix-turn-helix domain-containing protein [Streptomyces sp. ITFR-6]WNI31461.1 helix-turn-helix domain-containing protein [Streptomyces sp. ITFR-6]
MSTDLTTPPQERRGARNNLQRRPRHRGEERETLRQDLATGYGALASIRDLAAKHDLSYGLTRTLLLEAKVSLRSRNRRAKKAQG